MVIPALWESKDDGAEQFADAQKTKKYGKFVSPQALWEEKVCPQVFPHHPVLPWSSGERERTNLDTVPTY